MPSLSLYLLPATFVFIAQSEQLPSTPPSLSNTCVKPRSVLGTQDCVRRPAIWHSVWPEMSRTYYRSDQEVCKIFRSRHLGSGVKWFRLWSSPWSCSFRKKNVLKKKKERKDIPVVWSLTNELGLKLEVSAVDRVWDGKSGGVGSQLGTLQSLLFREPWLPHSGKIWEWTLWGLFQM